MRVFNSVHRRVNTTIVLYGQRQHVRRELQERGVLSGQFDVGFFQLRTHEIAHISQVIAEISWRFGASVRLAARIEVHRARYVRVDRFRAQ